MYLPIKGTFKKSEKDVFDDDYAIFLSDFLYKAYVVGTYLNCIDLSMQFRFVPTTYAFTKKYTKSTLAVI